MKQNSEQGYDRSGKKSVKSLNRNNSLKMELELSSNGGKKRLQHQKHNIMSPNEFGINHGPSENDYGVSSGYDKVTELQEMEAKEAH